MLSFFLRGQYLSITPPLQHCTQSPNRTLTTFDTVIPTMHWDLPTFNFLIIHDLKLEHVCGYRCYLNWVQLEAGTLVSKAPNWQLQPEMFYNNCSVTGYLKICYCSGDVEKASLIHCLDLTVCEITGPAGVWESRRAGVCTHTYFTVYLWICVCVCV